MELCGKNCMGLIMIRAWRNLQFNVYLCKTAFVTVQKEINGQVKSLWSTSQQKWKLLSALFCMPSSVWLRENRKMGKRKKNLQKKMVSLLIYFRERRRV